jgi:predicted nucleic acid-binding protein
VVQAPTAFLDTKVLISAQTEGPKGDAALAEVRALVDAAPPVTAATHDRALALAAAGAKRLPSEDIRSGRRFGDVVVESPFA